MAESDSGPVAEIPEDQINKNKKVIYFKKII
jgi:hypothetical protein